MAEDTLIKEILSKASEVATQNKNEYVTMEHILYILLDYPDISKVMNEMSVDSAKMKKDIIQFLRSKIPISKQKVRPIESVGVVRLFTYAMYVAQSTTKEINTVTLLAAICSFKDTHAYYFLASNGFDDEMIAKQAPAVPTEVPKQGYLVNMISLAKQGKYDVFIGREKELGQLMQTLAKVKRKNALIISEPGAGKTALVEGFAQAVAKGDVPDYLKNVEVYAMNIPAIIANTKMRGELEERVNGVVNEIVSRKAILFIDELQSVMGSSSQSNPMDISGILKPYLTNGHFKCIATTTYEDYKSIVKDRAFARRFQKIELTEPSYDDTIKILQGVLPTYEKHYGVKYDEKCLASAITLTQKYITDRFLPDKAIDLLDEVGADNFKNKKSKIIKLEDLERVLSTMMRMPLEKVTSNDLEVIKTLSVNLKSKIFGQDTAVDEVVNAIKLSKAGLTGKSRPLFSGIFAGGSGVGKTELVRQLAHNLGIALIRFDMSEYSEKHSVAKLIGSPPGYIGFDQGGMLIDAVIKNPHAVILLDEIEKADPSVYNILLQIMDYGFLTENAGRKADFRHCILVMTTNAGSQELASGRVGIGFGNTEVKMPVSEIDTKFSPEFRNRLDKIIYFNPIGKDLMLKIVDKFLGEFNDIIKVKKIEITLTDKAKDYIAEKSIAERLGARPVQKHFTALKSVLVDEILFNESKILEVDVQDEKFTYTSKSTEIK